MSNDASKNGEKTYANVLVNPAPTTATTTTVATTKRSKRDNGRTKDDQNSDVIVSKNKGDADAFDDDDDDDSFFKPQKESTTSMLISSTTLFYRTFSIWRERVTNMLRSVVDSQTAPLDKIELELYGANAYLILKQGVPFLVNLIEKYEQGKDLGLSTTSKEVDENNEEKAFFRFEELQFMSTVDDGKSKASLKDFTNMLMRDVNIWAVALLRFLTVCLKMTNDMTSKDTMNSAMPFDFESMTIAQTVSNSVSLIKNVLLDFQEPIIEFESKTVEGEDSDQKKKKDNIMSAFLTFINRKGVYSDVSNIIDAHIVPKTTTKKGKGKRSKKTKTTAKKDTETLEKPVHIASEEEEEEEEKEEVPQIPDEDVIVTVPKTAKHANNVVQHSKTPKKKTAPLNNGDTFSIVSKYLPGKRQHKCWVFEFKDYGIFQGAQPWKSNHVVDQMVAMEEDFELDRDDANTSLYNLKTYAAFWKKCQSNMYCSVKLSTQTSDTPKFAVKLNLPSFFWLQFFICLNTYGHNDDGVHKKALPSFSLGDLESEKDGRNRRVRKIRQFYDSFYLHGNHLEKQLYAFSFNDDLCSVAGSLVLFVENNPGFFNAFEDDEQALDTTDLLCFSRIVQDLPTMPENYEDKWVSFMKDYSN